MQIFCWLSFCNFKETISTLCSHQVLINSTKDLDCVFLGRWYLFVKISIEFDKYLLWSTKGGIAGIFLMSEHLETILHHHHHYHPRRRRHNSKYKVLSLKYKVHIYFCIFCKLDNQHQLVIVNRINQCQIEQKNCLCVVPWVHGKCFSSTENKRYAK